MRVRGQGLLAALAVLVAPVLGQPPERKVEGNVIASARNPEARIHLPPSLQYVGADRWVLYEIADCELHAFVEADEQQNVRRLVWVQFEGYLPTKPELHHTYDSPRHATIGGREFFVDTWVKPTAAKPQAGSDGEHIRALIRASDFKLPECLMSVRLVHLLDEQKRKELMIIYSEDAASSGFTSTELSEGGTAHDRWFSIEAALIERATKQVSFE